MLLRVPLFLALDPSSVSLRAPPMAHPCKFPEAVFKAINIKPILPEGSQDLLEKDKRSLNSVASIESIKNLILGNRRFN